MTAAFFAKGLAIGISIAAPVGPIGILCIRRSLRDGFWIGFATGMGAATADACYGCVAGFGLSAVSAFLVGHRDWIGLIGGAFLCFIGIRTMLGGAVADSGAGKVEASTMGAWASTFLLTLGNPSTIISFIAAFAAFGLGTSGGYSAASALVGGVFLGSAAWWISLSTAVSRLRSFITAGRMQGINRTSGAILILFGVYAVVRR